ncbi:cytosine deaminase [Schizosaccharomyces cryophilus OY26]|uniref:Cytosine deaminase n=1 Tax=Schizosaccharomyces cryophilus (strain OY26 / ATCC MYA-4695 / CBS 11777 / NBRC 106824 / NRRL Y48691) TaxID=653667 RepID=S9XHD8_SCHCR|nr:cytosine deaminase [Schizosaccharomyces cryophilus OY26]EPY53091.1 cytosine deaminase [Schizosaccharomyces cryophilus OY26]
MSPSTDILSEKDLKYLRQAIEISADARKHGQHPFGCIIVDENDKVVTTAENQVPSGDASQHAELRAVSIITKLKDAQTLGNCTLYTSTEPCVMCSGAIVWSGIGRIVFGLSNESLNKLAKLNPKNWYITMNTKEIAERASRPVQVLGPFIEDEAVIPHDHFWD